MTHNTDDQYEDSEYDSSWEYTDSYREPPARIIMIHSPKTDNLLGWVEIFEDDSVKLVLLSELEENS